MIWILLITGLVLRLISLNQSLWLDEAINILAVKNFSLNGLITQYAIADFHPPGWFILLWFWGKAFGYSEISMRLPSVFFGVATIYVTYLIGKKLCSKNIGLIAALILMINPLHIYYSQEARMYSLATLAVVINILLFLKIAKKEQVNPIFLILSNLLIFLSDYVAYFIFPAELIFLILLKDKNILKKWFIALIAGGVLISWWIPVFLSQLKAGAVASAKLPAWVFIVGGFDFKTIPLTFMKFIIGRISLADKTVYYGLLLPICVLFIFLLWRGVKALGNFQRKLIILWVVVPPLLATIISLVVPVYNYFRVLYILPGFILAIAAGIFYLKPKIRNSVLITVVFIEIICSLLYLFVPNNQREDWKGVVRFLQNSKPAVVLFESSGTLPPFDYYSKGAINAKGGLRDFPAKNSKDVADLENILQKISEVYLVEYLVQISDPQRYLQKKLAELDFRETEIKNFHGVGFVYHYKK